MTVLPSSPFTGQVPDADPVETEEWVAALDDVVRVHGPARARYLLSRLAEHASGLGLAHVGAPSTPYVNTIPLAEEPDYPGDEAIEWRIRALIRWNAAVMVVKANARADGIGGHLSSFASSASLYEVGFNHFFRGHDAGPGDHLYVQGHASPGIYARAYLEGRLEAEDLDRFRREIGGGGLSSYPHPRLMPGFWEYPTVSMGLGPLTSIYQARFNRYLHGRGLDDTSASRVWCFIGDGETDEPETLGAISLAGREGLDNLTWVVNCNLQRLDGPVRGNGKIIQELESVFRGAGWRVIKVVWGGAWDDLLARDVDGVLVDKMDTVLDGELQRFTVADGAEIRADFFGPDPRLRALVAHLDDDALRALPRGGHDERKVHAAYAAAVRSDGRPTVVLAQTVKGWTLGSAVEGRNATHQIKKLDLAQLEELRRRFHLEADIPEGTLRADREPPYLRPAPDSPEMAYLRERRAALGGSLPSRRVAVRTPLELPDPKVFAELETGSGRQAVSTTGAFTRLLRGLARDPRFGPRVVPIVPDEARTFGMDGLFKELGIYAAHGQRYKPVDADLLLSYTEAADGQILEEGISEAGAMASFIAAGSAHAARGVPMVPFFAFYSMFGFQRIGDLIWSAADSRARGFLLGATAGRTTLLGEGLQHQDGHSPLLASTVPTMQVYDPAYAYELAAIVRHGLDHMYGEAPEDVVYYLTLYNENLPQPARPEEEGLDDAIVRGAHRVAAAPEGTTHRATVWFSGTAQVAAQEAQALLAERFAVGVELWSVTSYKRLREDALDHERAVRLRIPDPPRPHLADVVAAGTGPVVAVTDYMKAVPDQVARWVTDRPFTSLGTDGFGRSDTREALRAFFEVDAAHVAVAVLDGLVRAGTLDPAVVDAAVATLGVDRAGPGASRAH
ncbi:MAG TPA: pyruvate dehydrogenase (acetyl-transferring), homodimeric type [Iamia sp.]|nr:pyruvate dehydrogenase (acetyl-transferring), homodimeric type [Iamia sp.]